MSYKSLMFGVCLFISGHSCALNNVELIRCLFNNAQRLEGGQQSFKKPIIIEEDDVVKLCEELVEFDNKLNAATQELKKRKEDDLVFEIIIKSAVVLFAAKTFYDYLNLPETKQLGRRIVSAIF